MLEMKRICLVMLFGMSVGLLTSCINEKYDLDEVDWTLGFGGDRLKLPINNSSTELRLDDFFKVEESDIISTMENGDYVLTKVYEDTEPTTVRIDKIVIESSVTENDDVVAVLPEVLRPFVGQTIDVSAYNIADSGRIAGFSYECDVTKEIKELDWVDVTDNNGDDCHFMINLSLPRSVRRFEFINVRLPEQILATWENPMEGAVFDTVKNTLTLKNYQSEEKLTLRFKVKRFYEGHSSDDNYADFNNGHISVKGSIFVVAKVAEITIPEDLRILLSGSNTLDKINIVRAHGLIDPEIEMKDMGTITIDTIPDYLKDEEAVTDLDNPQLWLTVRSTLPLGGTIKAIVRSDVYPEGIKLDTPGRIIRIKGSNDGMTETETRVLLCRYNPGVNTDEYQVIEDANLPKLIGKMHDGMTLEFEATEVKANQEPTTIDFDYEYHLWVDCYFTALLAFGPHAAIAYHDTFHDWNEDIKDVRLSKDGYLHFKATVVNRIPADLEVNVVPIDKEGHILDDLRVEMLVNEVPGSRDGAVESPLELRIVDTTGQGVTQLDGMKLELKVSSNDQLQGVVLNKSQQTLLLKDVQVELVGKIIYDANKENDLP